MAIKLKRCTKCKIAKGASIKIFSKHTKTKDGFQSWCRECSTALHVRNYAMYPKIRERAKLRAALQYLNEKQIYYCAKCGVECNKTKSQLCRICRANKVLNQLKKDKRSQ